jgi:hypothetical protein
MNSRIPPYQNREMHPDPYYRPEIPPHFDQRGQPPVNRSQKPVNYNQPVRHGQPQVNHGHPQVNHGQPHVNRRPPPVPRHQNQPTHNHGGYYSDGSHSRERSRNYNEPIREPDYHEIVPPPPPPSVQSRSYSEPDYLEPTESRYHSDSSFPPPPPQNRPVHNRHQPENNRYHDQPVNNRIQHEPVNNRFQREPDNNRLQQEPGNNQYQNEPRNNRLQQEPGNNRYHDEPVHNRYQENRLEIQPTSYSAESELDSPRAEVVIPKVQGVGTLAHRFEKQARIHQTQIEISNLPKPPPKPLFYRDEHRDRLRKML